MVGRSFSLIALALIAALDHSPALAADVVNVVTPTRVIFALPFWIAERKGYFKDENIEAKLDLIANGREITKRLMDGTSQFSIVGPDDVMIDATKGGPLRIVAGVVRKPPLFLIAQSSIHTFAELRGSTIGVLSLTEGSSKLLAKMLKTEGVSPSDLTLKPGIGAPGRQQMLKDGKIDAGMQPLPLNFEAETLGFNNLGWAGQYEPDWQFTTVNTNAAWARAHSRIVVGFLRALLRGQQLIWSNPNEAVDIAADALQALPALAERALEDAKARGMLDPRLDWSTLGLQRIYENKQADGAIPADQPFDVGKVTDATYLRQAQSPVERK